MQTTSTQETEELPSRWQPYQEPLYVTLLRTVAIAMVVAAVVTVIRGDLARWPVVALLALWPSFGGHWIEIFFLNWLRPHLPAARSVQVTARLAVWYLGGCVLGFATALTAMAILPIRSMPWSRLWLAGLAFIGIELTAHVFLQLRRKPNFYNGQG